MKVKIVSSVNRTNRINRDGYNKSPIFLSNKNRVQHGISDSMYGIGEAMRHLVSK